MLAAVLCHVLLGYIQQYSRAAAVVERCWAVCVLICFLRIGGGLFAAFWFAQGIARRTERQTARQTAGQTDGLKDRRTGRQTDRKTDSSIRSPKTRGYAEEIKKSSCDNNTRTTFAYPGVGNYQKQGMFSSININSEVFWILGSLPLNTSWMYRLKIQVVFQFLPLASSIPTSQTHWTQVVFTS